MPSDGNAGSILTTSLVPGSQTPTTATSQPASGKLVPAVGKNVAQPLPAGSAATPSATAPPRAAASGTSDPQSLVDLLNKFLNDSGRPDRFRIDPASDNQLIQEINPATGKVIGEFSVTEFPALARSIGATGLLIDSRV